MEFPYFIIISGPPATGKTTLGLELKKYFQIPFINKDLIKEILFETLELGDREYSRKLGFSSSKLLNKLLEIHLEVKKTLIIENAFFSQLESANLLKIISTYNAIPIEIHCNGSMNVIIERFLKRDKSETRHSGHKYVGSHIEIKNRLQNNTYGILNLNSKIIILNTDHFETIKVSDLIEKIESITKIE